jgi:glycyl-tRNA synthetase beta chain
MADHPAPASTREDLLIELGCEELPPKALDSIREAFFEAVAQGLAQSHIAFDAVGSRPYSTPRRLALYFRAVAPRQADQLLERRGPAVQAAFDDAGRPTPAALGFARSVGREVDQLERLKTDKGEWLFARVEQPGQPLDELIVPVLEQAIKQLPVPKPMRWADHDFDFVRPVHWLVLLHGERVIDGALLGQRAGNVTRGHRIHAPGPHALSSASEYVGVLQSAYVMADHRMRSERIRGLLLEANPGVLIDEDLLSEVNNLVEWPVAVSCSFDEAFLEVPHAALVASMQDHQKFFPVQSADDPQRVTNRFVGVANLESADIDAVRAGYERVIRPRLADARFFLEQDQKQPLEAYLPLLDRVVFQKDIGSIGDKTKRTIAISKKLAEVLSTNVTAASRAATLAKCDLMTQMVGEFPELQGVMGSHYARSSGEQAEVSAAIAEHYSPRFSGDAVPASDTGRIVAIADRVDTLVGIFAAGLKPSGNRDPFALRRAALGLIRILLEAGLELPLNRLLALAANALSGAVDVESSLLLEVREFIVGRQRQYYRDQGFSAEIVEAAVASDWDTFPDFDRRVRALDAFMGQEDAASLAAANKRIGNILRRADEDIDHTIDENRVKLSQERALFDEIRALESELEPLLSTGDYTTSLRRLARLRAPVDDFFDAVLVMDEDPVLRNNRLALLARLKGLFDRIADLSVLG